MAAVTSTSGYAVPSGCLDEVFDSNGEPRPHAASLIASLERLGPKALQEAGRRRDTIFMQQGILRHHGIAARYVSGYLFAAPGGGGQELVEVDTHTWLEALLPMPGDGEPVWVGADPTNRGLAGENHVKIGHGRHYPDVPPIKGVYRGVADAKLEASVTMTRLPTADTASIARS